MASTLVSDDGTTRVYRHTDDTGAVTGWLAEPIELPPTPTVDLAAQVQALTDAVDQLILDSLGA